MKNLMVLMIGLLPHSSAKVRLLNALGHALDPTASFGPCLIVNVIRMELGPGARIGPFNVLRDITHFELGAGSVIGQFNWLSAAKPLVEKGAPGSFRMGGESSLTSRHYVDLTGGVQIGNFTTVAGVRSTFVTHGIDWRQAAQSWKAITIGDYCIVGSTCCLTPGTEVAHSSVVGMGSTLSGHLEADHALYLGSRARSVKAGLAGQYFKRSSGSVE